MSAEHIEFCHPIQPYAATRYSLKLPVSTLECCHGKSGGFCGIIRAEGVPRCLLMSNLRVAGNSPGSPGIHESARFSLAVISKRTSPINHQLTLVGGNHHQSCVVLEMASAEARYMSEQSAVQFAS